MLTEYLVGVSGEKWQLKGGLDGNMLARRRCAIDQTKLGEKSGSNQKLYVHIV